MIHGGILYSRVILEFNLDTSNSSVNSKPKVQHYSKFYVCIEKKILLVISINRTSNSSSRYAKSLINSKEVLELIFRNQRIQNNSRRAVIPEIYLLL